MALLLYTRAGCPLCDDMAEVVRERLGGQPLVEIDVDSNPELKTRFGWDVPLLFDGEREICRHFFDPEAFGRWQAQS